MAVWWLITFVVLIGIEAMTLSLTTIWFAGGALVTFLLALFGVSNGIQWTVFLVVSLLLLILTRPFATRFINSNKNTTNVEGLIGCKGKVLIEVNNQNETGYILVKNQEWAARSYMEDEVYPIGTMVIIRHIEGVKVIVEKVSGTK